MARRNTIEVPLAAVVAGGTALALLAISIWSHKRRPDAHVREEPSATMRELFPSLVGATQSSLCEGNSIEILENGRFFDVLLEEMRGARRSITLETFLWKPGKLSASIVEVLSAKAREGVEVRVLVDGNGGKISREEIETLRDAGCGVERYNPFAITHLSSFNNRNHRKLCVVDGRVGFIGGHCVVDLWLGDAEEGQVRDLSVRVRGPVVADLQSTYLAHWIETAKEVLIGEAFFPKLEPAGSIAAHVVYLSAPRASSSIELMHYVAIASAREQIRIQNPYFVPDPAAVRALAAAVARGVDVRVMLPAPSASDAPIVQHASHHRFGALLESGVRIFEYERSLLHQKVITVDHCWSAIGSANFDDRSFELNDEATLGILDEGIARHLEAIFERDLEYSTEYSLDAWKNRSIGHKLKDGAGFAVNEQL